MAKSFDAKEPTLVIEDLKLGYSHGTVGLSGGATGGYFSNFTYKVEPVTERPERKPFSNSGWDLSKWELSETFELIRRIQSRCRLRVICKR